MADEHTSPATSTPDSHPHGDNSQRELKAAKDRACPFCNQAFTSSSLGRHLDLYIKPRNPKPPDGVHDVDEIRKMRGGITRRQPRTSLKGGSVEKDDAPASAGGGGGHTRENSLAWGKGEEQESGSGGRAGRESGGEGKKVTERRYVDSPTAEKDSGVQTYFNAPNWQTTGVINDLPARAPSRSHNATPTTGGGQAQRMQEMRRDNAGNRIERPDYVAEDMWKLQEQAEVGKAAEMALREVLGSLEAAQRKVEPRGMYDDFDFLSLSFPALCLAILPPPPALFSTTPFGQPHTWGLTPPAKEQYEAVNRMVNERSARLRDGRTENMSDAVIFKHHVHLAGAYEHWQRLPESERQAAWTLEMSRALVGERGRKDDYKRELENARQRIQHLEAEYDRLSRCQLPREYLLHPPNTLPVPQNLMREMPPSHAQSAAVEAKYDADALLNKWKAVVKSTARPPRHPTTYPPPSSLQTYPQEIYVEKFNNPMKSDILLNGSVFGVGGPMARDDVGTRANGGGQNRDDGKYQYATPQVPGTVVGAEEETPRSSEADAQAEEDDSGGYAGGAGALTRTKRAGEFCAPVNGMLNGNGKRPLEGGVGVNGGGRGYKRG